MGLLRDLYNRPGPLPTRISYAGSATIDPGDDADPTIWPWRSNAMLPTPDALLIRDSPHWQGPLEDRVRTISDIADSFLCVDRDAGERSYIRPPVNGNIFVSKSLHDTMNFPKGHPRHGDPRYRWEWRGDLECGYLLPEATSPAPAKSKIVVDYSAEHWNSEPAPAAPPELTWRQKPGML